MLKAFVHVMYLIVIYFLWKETIIKKTNQTCQEISGSFPFSCFLLFVIISLVLFLLRLFLFSHSYFHSLQFTLPLLFPFSSHSFSFDFFLIQKNIICLVASFLHSVFAFLPFFSLSANHCFPLKHTKHVVLEMHKIYVSVHKKTY